MRSYNSGIHDPYQYESFIGLKYILEMLETDTGIEAVAFQSTEIDKLDDVVVKYFDGSSMCIQVKHTRVENNFTLNDLIRPSSRSSASLIRDMADAWKEGSKRLPNCIPALYTNRHWGTNTSKTMNGSVYPSLSVFWPWLKRELKRTASLSEIRLNSGFDAAWNDLLAQLDVLGSDTSKYEFLKNLRLRFNQPGLINLEKNLRKEVGRIFGVTSPSVRSDIFEKLVASLRHWTKQGKVEFVNPEEVYRRLSLATKLEESDHKLPPPVPFFKSRVSFLEYITEELGSDKHSVIFLKGNPGSGKSSLVSQLADEVSNLVIFRYHAFKPITPDMKELSADVGSLVEARTLWTALLDQIRMKFEGQLYRYRVPIRSDYLTIAQIREHVLRLAKELSNIRHKLTIIAIDGIDHAARAGYMSREKVDTFLPWLVHPTDVPDGVRFLLAGQPPEGYSSYPHWLKVDRDDVLSIEMPAITESDIQQFLLPQYPRELVEPAARVIREAVAGNTLAAIFAVREVSGCNSIEELTEKLRAKKLHDGIHAYYEHIWSHAVYKVQSSVTQEIAYLNEKLAGCFSLSSEPLDGVTLRGVFADSLLAASDWNYLLKDLEPLVIEQEKGKFVLFHNDVRVYFMRYILTRRDILESLASSLADFYLVESSYKIARHADLFSLLNLSKRKEEFVSIFNPSYIMEAWAIRRPITEIRAQCMDMLAILKERQCWADMGGALEALRTVQQLLISYNKANERNYIIEEDCRAPAFVPSEGVVKPAKAWDIDMLKSVLEDIRRLAKHGKYERARRVMERWFQRNGVTPFQLLDLLPEFYVYEFSLKREKPGTRFLELISEWGQVAGITSNDVWRIQAEDLRSHAEEQVANAYFDGFLRESFHRSRFSFFKCLKKYLPLLVPEKKVTLAERMINEQRWMELRYILKNTDPLSLPFQHRIKLAMYSCIVNSETERFVYPVVEQGYNILEHEKMNYETDAKLYSCVCFLRSWAYPESDLKQQALEAIQAYYSYDRDPRSMEMVHLLFNCTSRVGAYYRLSKHEGIRFSKHDIGIILYLIERLYMMDQSMYGHLVGYIEVRTFFMKMVMFLSRHDEALDRVLYKAIRDSIIVGDIFCLDMELVWGFLNLHGDRKSMELIFYRWVGKNGIVWQGDLEKGIFWIERFITLAEKYQMHEEGRHLKDMLAWKWFAMTARRSASMHHALRWVELLLQAKPTLWKQQGLALLDLCRQLVGESSIVADSAASVVMAAAQKDGVETLWTIFNENGMLDVDNFRKYKVIFDVLINVLKDCSATEDDLVAIWLLTVGGLSWRDRDSRAYIEDMRKCVLKAAHRLGYTGFGTNMKQMTSYHFDIHNVRDRDNRPERWFETRRERYMPWESTRKQVERKVRKYSLEEAFDDFQHSIKSLDQDGGRIEHVAAFYYAEILAHKISKEHSLRYKEYCDVLFDFTGIHAAKRKYYRNEQYIEDFYSALIAIASDDETRWRVLEPLIPDTIDNGTLSYFIAKLEEILQVRAEKIGFQEILDATNLVISTYEQWFRGNADMPSVSTNSLAQEVNQMSWKQFTLNVLIRNLSSHNEWQIEAALQGIWQYVNCDNTIVHDLISKWDTIGGHGKVWIILLIERIAAAYPHYYEQMKPLLDELESDGGLTIRTLANVIIKTFERGHCTAGEDSSPWLLRKFRVITSRLNRGKERNCVHDIEYPQFQDRLLNQRVYQIASIFPERVTSLLDELEASVNANVKTETKLLQIIEKRIENGTWERTSIYNEVQAYLPCDDPFLLLDLPYAFRRTFGWLNISLMVTSHFNEKDACSQFINQAQKGLRKDHKLLGAAMLHFNIAEGYYFTCGLSEDGEFCRSVASGRSFLFYNPESSRRKDPFSELFYNFRHINGQRIPYSSTVLLVPSPAFNSLSWSPSTSNPLVWEKHGKRMMWMEQIFGPYHEGVQPFLQRWVCTKEGFEEILRIKQNPCYFITLEPMRVNASMMDLPNSVRVIM